MSFLSLEVLAVGLAMDAAAVSASCGVSTPRLRLRHFLLVAAFFGGFQALMPLLGYLLGARIGSVVSEWDHWIAFVLLGGIGLHMIFEARDADDADDEEEPRSERDLFGLRMLSVLAIATSIDAFAVGITLPMLDAPLSLSLVAIGVTTAALSALGLWVGRRFGARVGRRMDAFGGVVLVLFGTKILIQHLS
ncbi:MAG TPA: manganese efflux pump MntP family protein [Polyangiales bacterium]|nr:manganese efflux pump MntP family protein [Polyangiales bacterium]